jgi:hypothetical protein
MHVIEDAIGPSSRVILEANPNVGTCVVVDAGLDDPGAVFLERFQGLRGRTNDGNVPGHMFVRILEQDQHQVPLVGQSLGLAHI